MRLIVALLIFCICAANAEVRMWTEGETGRSFEAELVSVKGEAVELRRSSDGRRFEVPLARLSEGDREFVAGHAAGASGEGGLPKAKEDLFEDIEWDSAEEIPVAGEAERRFAGVDKAILDFMVAKGVGAAVVAVSREGKVEYDRAFGFQDAKLKEPIRVGTSMRLASISKPVTAAVAKTLIRDRKMKLEDKVFELLKLEEGAPKDLDPRWKDVTVEHLLKHEGGWDRDVDGDPSFKAPTVAQDQGVDLDEVDFDHLLAWMLERPLDFDPGSKDAYSNFGYTLLAKVCATVAGLSWHELLQETVAKEAEMTTLVVSPTSLEERVAGEIWYHYHPEYQEEPETMPLRMEFKYGSGSMACTAADLCRFLESYWISGEPREGNGYRYNFFGSMPGTTTASGQRGDGVSFAVLTNRRDKSPSDWNEELKKAMDAALDEVNW